MKHKNLNATFGSKIAALRKTRGFTQQKLADAIGVSRRNLAYYETQTGRIPVDMLANIAEVLCVSVDDIINLDIQKTDGRSVEGKFWQKWQHLQNEDKKTLSRLADSLLAKN